MRNFFAPFEGLKVPRFSVPNVFFTKWCCSNETDLSAAKPYADYVATSGNDLIVVGMGSEFNANTLQNTLGLQPIISTTYSDALADEVNLA